MLPIARATEVHILGSHDRSGGRSQNPRNNAISVTKTVFSLDVILFQIDIKSYISSALGFFCCCCCCCCCIIVLHDFPFLITRPLFNRYVLTCEIISPPFVLSRLPRYDEERRGLATLSTSPISFCLFDTTCVINFSDTPFSNVPFNVSRTSYVGFLRDHLTLPPAFPFNTTVTTTPDVSPLCLLLKSVPSPVRKNPVLLTKT